MPFKGPELTELGGFHNSFYNVLVAVYPKLFNNGASDMAWVYLALGIVFEVCGTTALKLSDGFSQWLPTMISIGCFVTALFFLSLSVRVLDVSIVYAIWSGVGVAMITVIGIILFSESWGFTKLFFTTLIIVGVIGLQAQGSEFTLPPVAEEEG